MVDLTVGLVDKVRINGDYIKSLVVTINGRMSTNRKNRK